MRTLAIIPAFNESAALPIALQDLRDTLPDVDILVIDDGSWDATADVARANGAKVATLPFNLGIGAALRTGFKYACERGYDRAFQFDADGQHLAAHVPALLAELDAGADLAIGTRFTVGSGDYEVGKTRGLAMSLLRFALRSTLGASYTDTSSGFRAFSAPMLRHFARWYPREYMDSVEALVMAVNGGFRVTEVPVDMRERVAGVASNRSLKLAYHYTRLLLVIAVTVRVRRTSVAEVVA